MNKQELIETVKELMAAPSCCEPLKTAAQAWLDAAGTAGKGRRGRPAGGAEE